MTFELNCSWRHSHRGVIGVESAIVMIAFVIVAAALVFVIINVGNNAYDKQEESEIPEPKNIEDCVGLEVHTSRPCYALVLEKKIDEFTIRLDNMENQK